MTSSLDQLWRLTNTQTDSGYEMSEEELEITKAREKKK